MKGFSAEERQKAITLSDPYLKDIENVHHRGFLLKAINLIPAEERSESIKSLVSFFQGDSNVSAFFALSQIPREARGQSILMTMSLFKDPIQCRNFLKCISQVPDEDRLSFWQELQSVADSLKEQRLSLDLLSALSLIDPSLRKTYLGLLREFPSQQERKLIFYLTPFIVPLLKRNRIDLIHQLFKGVENPLLEEELMEEVLKNPTASHYFLNVHPELIASRMEERGGYARLTPEGKMNLLPILPSHLIQEVAQGISHEDAEKHLQTEIEFDGVSEPLRKMLDTVYVQRVAGLKWKGNQDENTLIQEVESFLSKIPFYSLALAARDPDLQSTVMAFIPAMNELQIAVVLPQLTPEVFLGLLKENRGRYGAINFLLNAATLEQKKVYLATLQKEPFTGNAYAAFYTASESVKKALLKGVEDPNFKSEVELFFSSLAKPTPKVILTPEIPKKYQDPITLELMGDPVIVHPSEKIYERSSIEAWILKSNRDPLTRAEIKSIEPATELKKEIDEWKKRQRQDETA